MPLQLIVVFVFDRGKAVVGASVVERAGGRVVLAPLKEGVSTSEIAQKVAESVVVADRGAAEAARAAAERAYAETEARAREPSPGPKEG